MKKTCRISDRVKPFRRGARGVTLVELMVTLAVLVILVAVGAPELSRFIAQRGVVAQADTVIADLQFARSEAMKRGLPVTLCLSANPTATTPSCAAASKDWSTGWIIFVDRLAAAGAYQEKEELLRVQQGIRSGAFGPKDDHSVITFNAMGMTPGNKLSFKVTPRGGSTDQHMNRCVVLTAQGRVRSEAGSCSSS